MDSSAATRLCSHCQIFDVRAMLLAAERSPRKGMTFTNADAHSNNVRSGLPQFFEQQPNLLALKHGAHECDLCNAIWSSYAKAAQPFELTDEAVTSGLGSEPIFFGTTPWDKDMHALPHLVASQHGERDVVRSLAWLEVIAKRGALVLGRQRHRMVRYEELAPGRSSTSRQHAPACTLHLHFRRG